MKWRDRIHRWLASLNNPGEVVSLLVLAALGLVLLAIGLCGCTAGGGGGSGASFSPGAAAASAATPPPPPLFSTNLDWQPWSVPVEAQLLVVLEGHPAPVLDASRVVVAELLPAGATVWTEVQASTRGRCGR